VVVLTGEVDKFSERAAAKRAALRVRGVTAVVNEVRVHPSSRYSVSDTDVAKEVEHALRAAGDVPDTVQAEIVGHDVNLTGMAEWDYQRRAAVRVVQHLRGVTSVNNAIALTPRVSASDTGERIKQAIVRNALLDAKAIDVSVAGHRVTLSGTVRSWAERRQADLAAWSSPHVTDVYNHIVVREA
jgi:osmotically-inducible protein OsmY